MNNEREELISDAIEAGFNIRSANVEHSLECLKKFLSLQIARATLQTKPVATLRITEKNTHGFNEHSLTLNSMQTDDPFEYLALCKRQGIGEHNLFTLPPSTVPVEKYNNLLDALKEILSGWNAGVIDAEESMLKIDAEIKAIAEAEGKEG